MAFEQGLYQLITQDSGCIAAGIAGNVRWSYLPNGAQSPAVVIHTISTVPVITLESTLPLNEKRVQFDVYASSYYGTKAGVRALKALLQDFSGTLPDGTVVQSVLVGNDYDAPFEIGAGGFLDRACFDCTFWFDEN